MSEPIVSQHQEPVALHRSEGVGSSVLVVALAIVLVAAMAASFFLPPEIAERMVIGILAILAVIGIMGLFFYAVGFIQLTGQGMRNDITKRIADSDADGILVTEGEARIIYANQTYLSLCGASDLASIRTVDRLFSGTPEVSESIYRLAQAARENKRGAEELRLSPPLTGAAAAGWYRVRVRPLEREGAKRATLWSVADVTRERERHENVFLELQHAIDFLDHAPAGFFSADPAGAISYMNATLASWLDYDLAHVGSGGLRLSDIVAGDGAAMLTSLGGIHNEVKTESFDVDLKRRNGQSLPVRLLHRVAFGQDRQPGPSRTLVLNRAPGNEPAEDLRAAQVRFARFFNSTPMAIATVSDTGAIARSNVAFAKLLPSALIADPTSGERQLLAALAERDRPALLVAIAAASNNTTDIAPVDAMLLGGEARSARFFISPAEETEGAAATVFALDTTEQRTLQESFAQSHKMQAIGQLAGGVAHDFNNVLTAIIGFSDLLLAQHRPTDPSFQDIMQIRQNANRAAGLVRQLLAFSRRQTLRPQVLQLGDILSELQIMLRRLVKEKVDLDLKHGRDLWFVKADSSQLEQVVVNLVVNANDALRETGKITLRTRNVASAECAKYNEKSLVEGEYVAIEVEDNGHGIPDDVKQKIFEPFFTTKETGKGTGLGLSMVYGIIKQTGGYIFCESTPGKGTVFSILLPRYIPTPSDEPTAREPVAKAAAADLTGQGVILLVEDEEAVRAFAARALTSRGYTVLQAASGLEALDVVASVKGKLDLIVSDVVMPEMDGPTMLGELRKRGIKAKVIFASGYAEEAFAKNLPPGEEFGFMPKPFSLKQLIETVKTHMN